MGKAFLRVHLGWSVEFYSAKQARPWAIQAGGRSQARGRPPLWAQSAQTATAQAWEALNAYTPVASLHLCVCIYMYINVFVNVL